MTSIKYMALLLFLIIPCRSFAQDYSFHNYGSSEGLPQPYIYSIIQDHRGYLWLGTAEGLSEFNGFVFRNYSKADSLADMFVAAGIADGIQMWFGHRNGSITFYDGKKFYPVHTGRKLSSVTHFARNPAGETWIGTLSDGILKLENGSVVPGVNLFTDKRQLLSFEFVSDNEILAATDGGLLHIRISSTGDQTIEEIMELKGIRVPVLSKIKHGSGFFAADENGDLYKITSENQTVRVENLISTGSLGIKEIYGICDDAEGNIWIATFGKGIVKLSPAVNKNSQITYFNTSTGFVSDNVRVIFEDNGGNIWAGNYGNGLTMLTRKLFNLKIYGSNQNDKNIFAVESSERFRWIGTGKGLLKVNRSSGEMIRSFGTESGLPEDTVSSLYLADNKELWIGTYKNGLFRKDTGNGFVRKFSLAQGILENSVTSLSGKDGIVWAGTQKGLYRIDVSSGTFEYYTISRGGLPHNSVSCLYTDKTGRLWITTNSSILSYFDNGIFNKIPLSSGQGIITLGPVVEDASSRIWVGSKGSGVFVIEEDSILYLSSREGLLSDYCYALTCDKNQNIWVGHKNGLSRLRILDFAVKTVSHIDGVSGDFQVNKNSATIDKSGIVLLGTDRGLITYDPSADFKQDVPPLTGITSVKVNNEEIMTDGKELVLPPGVYKIRIDYFGLSLKEPDQVKYQYKLENYDDWSELTKETFITYPRLSYGKYNFFLKASSGDGSVTEDPLIFSILIRTPVWRKWWFWVCSLILVVIIAILYTKWRVRRLIYEKRILEEKIAERTMEIQNQKNKIEFQRNEIEQQNINITSSITYASKIQCATLPPPELIDSLLPESFVFHRPKDIVSGDFYWLCEKEGKIIVAVSDCTGHGVPGAFMSLLGITLLNEIVNIHGITDSKEILDTLKGKVISSLLQNRKDSITSDGMDMSLCVINREKMTLQFTGAMNDILYISDGKRYVIKSDKMDVSPADWNAGEFTSQILEYKNGDMIYLFSDGYQDQFGGEFDKKFLKPHFYNILYEMSNLPVKEQAEFLNTKLKNWMREHLQTDDITVLGIRL